MGCRPLAASIKRCYARAGEEPRNGTRQGAARDSAQQLPKETLKASFAELKNILARPMGAGTHILTLPPERTVLLHDRG